MMNIFLHKFFRLILVLAIGGACTNMLLKNISTASSPINLSSASPASVNVTIDFNNAVGLEATAKHYGTNAYSGVFVDRGGEPGNSKYKSNVDASQYRFVRYHTWEMMRDSNAAPGGWVTNGASGNPGWDANRVRNVLSGMLGPGKPWEQATVVMNIPGWTNGWKQPGSERLRTDRYEQYADWCNQLVQIVRGAGYNVVYWEITNERDDVYSGEMTELARIYNTVVNRIKASHSGLKFGGAAFARPDLVDSASDRFCKRRAATLILFRITPTSPVTPTRRTQASGMPPPVSDGKRKITRTDPTINFDWGIGAPAGAGLTGPDDFSVRWTGEVQAPASGAYTFTTRSDDGVRLWVNGQQLIKNWTEHAPTDDSGVIVLSAGQRYSIRLEYYERGGGATIKLFWSYPGQAQQIVPQSRLYPASGETPPPGGDWTFCANEGGQCKFTGTREVRYGANGQFFYRTFTNGAACNNGVFGDPIYGVAKQCSYRSTTGGGNALYRAINLNGSSLVIDGETWEGQNAPNYSADGGRFCNQSVALTPATDAARAEMIRCSVWGRGAVGVRIALTAVPSATYDVYLYVWEDNNSETFNVVLDGQTVQSNYTSGAVGEWRRLGPFRSIVSDGTLEIWSSGGAANFSGIEVHRL